METSEQPVKFINTELPDIIELREVKQSYGDKAPIIKGLNLLIEDKPNQGQFIVILGRSGCGKSTILRFIAGLERPTEGKVLIYGKERTPKDRVGMVFQQYSSFPWMSVLDNVALGLQYQGVPRKKRREQAMEIIVKVGLEGHEDKYAQYPTLSGGQLQRVAIARSLLYESKILLMDEPFGALDIETRLQMQELLAKIWVEIDPTIVFVTHDIPEAVYLGDDIYIMGGNPSNIMEKFVSPLPLERNKSMKREISFQNKVNEIEDYMLNIGRHVESVGK
jgi:NitT/TauT family transport system ATP-binding protein